MTMTMKELEKEYYRIGELQCDLIRQGKHYGEEAKRLARIEANLEKAMGVA